MLLFAKKWGFGELCLLGAKRRLPGDSQAAPRRLPDIVVHAFGTFLNAFDTYVEGFGLDFYSVFLIISL